MYCAVFPSEQFIESIFLKIEKQNYEKLTESDRITELPPGVTGEPGASELVVRPSFLQFFIHFPGGRTWRRRNSGDSERRRGGEELEVVRWKKSRISDLH